MKREPMCAALARILLAALLAAAVAAPTLADGVEILPLPLSQGCLGIKSYGIPLFDTGTGSVTVNPPGPILGAYIHWVGVEDDTPAGAGTSALTINGTSVTGTLSAGPAGHSNTSDWWSWWANIGPSAGPYSGLGLVDDLNKTVTVSDWDSGDNSTNGATVTVIYDTSPCTVPNSIELHMGIDYYYYGFSGEEFTELLVFAFSPVAQDQVVSFHVSHAGTDYTQVSCRGGSVWMLAGTGTPPGPADFDILALGAGGRGYGINGGIEVVNDPFTTTSLPCVPALNPSPDEPYEAGHPCPGGGAACPYRSLALRPPEGGDVGAEWAVVEIDVLVPANSTWVAFQLESEADQSGESGSWAGSSYLFGPLPFCGDGILDPGEECDDGNNIDGDGCDHDCKKEVIVNNPPAILCAPCEYCADPFLCTKDVACTSIAAACDPDGDPVTLTCDPSGPYPLGTTSITVTGTDGTFTVTEVCSVTVRDCESPVCTPPPDLALECNSPCGVPVSDPAIQGFLSDAAASDNCGTAGISNFAPPLFASACGSGLTTNVGFAAMDDSGYERTCSASVTVTDTTPPDLACPPFLSLECHDPGGIHAGDPAIASWIAAATSSDACGSSAVANTAPPLFPSGCAPGAATNVTFTATDTCGLTSACTTQVTVADTTPPSLTCPASITLECTDPGGVPSSDGNVQAWIASATAGDSCGTVTVTNDAPPLLPTGCSPGQPTTVTFTATDGCGLVSRCTAEITVIDTTPPVVTSCGMDEFCLWPPDHRYVCFDEFLTFVNTEDACSNATLAGIQCESNQCDEAPCDEHPGQNGDGNTVNDCYYDPETDQLCVRSERAGTDEEGRIYTVSVVVQDECGNAADPEVVLTIRVPHDQSEHDVCLSPSPKAPK